MVYVPHRADLYAAVDREFHFIHDDAPDELSATDPAHAEWRRAWLDIRDRFLNEETDRVFWARFPDAPLRLHPSDAEHGGWIPHWRSTRDEIMTAGATEAGVDRSDLSYLRADLYWALVRATLDGDRPVDQATRAFADDVVAAAGQEIDKGWQLGDPDFSRARQIDDAGDILTFTAYAWWSQDVVRGRLDIKTPWGED